MKAEDSGLKEAMGAAAVVLIDLEWHVVQFPAHRLLFAQPPVTYPYRKVSNQQ